MSSKNRSSARVGIAERTDSTGVPSYRGTAHDKRTGKQLKGPWTATLAEARAWRIDALARLQAGTLSGNRGPTVREAVDKFVAGIGNGSIRNRSGDRYKPSTIRGYERDLRGRVAPSFGASRLAELSLPDLQRWADALAAEGLSASSVRNAVNGLRAVYGWAMPRGLASVNPTTGLRLPTGEKSRQRIATPAEATALTRALLPRDHAALGLAVYGGLRLGELLALRWSAIDLAGGTLRVERSWDPGAQRFVAPKSKAGRRTVPIIDRLARLLDDHRVITNQGDGLLFPGERDSDRPVHPTSLRDRLSGAWEAAGLEPLGFHEARHTFASLMIAAGVNAKALSTYMGHGSIGITFDTYGHLFPGNEAQAAGLLNAYLQAQS